MTRDDRKRLDVRTERTYKSLSAALVDLMHSREFNDITVQDLLDRAGVGRATFYSHFRSKDDFLFTDLERMLALLESHFDRTSVSTTRVAPVAELFEHLKDVRGFAEALERSGHMEAVLDIASGHFARIIERRLRALNAEPRELPLNAAARVLAPWSWNWGNGGSVGRRYCQPETWMIAFTNSSGAGSATHALDQAGRPPPGSHSARHCTPPSRYPRRRSGDQPAHHGARVPIDCR